VPQVVQPVALESGGPERAAPAVTHGVLVRRIVLTGREQPVGADVLGCRVVDFLGGELQKQRS